MSGEFLSETLEYVRLRVADAAVSSGRLSSDVRLVAVSKTRPEKALRSAYGYGQLDFAENYVQEWATKADELADLPDLQWHFVGALQSNKVREIVNKVALIHSVDRAKLIDEIAGRAESPQPILIQVNIAGEAQKAGCTPDEALLLVRHAISTGLTPPMGLMTVPPESENPEDARPYFRALRALRDDIKQALVEDFPEAAEAFHELSMGMSHDLPQAIEEGATIVRIGTAIFGARPSKSVEPGAAAAH